MNVSSIAPLAFAGILAVTSGIVPTATVPSAAQIQDARIAKLEGQVARLQAVANAYNVHVHSYLHARNPTTYMSIHDLSIAMQPHSDTPTTDYYVPLILSSAGAPDVGGTRERTSSPTVDQ